MGNVRRLEKCRARKNKVGAQTSRSHEHVDGYHERNLSQSRTPRIGVRKLRDRVEVIEPSEVELAGPVLSDKLGEMGERYSLICCSVRIGIESRTRGNQCSGSPGIVHAITFMTDMPAEQRQIYLRRRGVSAVFCTLIPTHVLDNNSAFRLSVIARNPSYIIIGNARLTLNLVLSPFIGLRFNAVENGYIPVSYIGIGNGKHRFCICSIMRNDSPRFCVIYLIGDIVDKGVGFQAGGDDYMVKPFDPRELLMHIEAQLRRANMTATRPIAEEVLSVGRFTVDTIQFRATKGAERLTLTPKEFKIFHTLMANPGVVLSKEQLVEAAWGKEFVGETSSITVFIKKLREKVEDDPSDPHIIQTVWGIGYRLEPEAC